MSIDDDSLYLYHLTLRAPSNFTLSVLGQFLGEKKSQEILVSSVSTLQLLRPNAETGKIEVVASQNTLGVIHKIEKIRIVGTQKDLAVVVGESGKVVFLEFDVDLHRFVPVLQEPYAKTGFGRVNPGEYLAVDPQSRCIFLGAIERNKLIFKVETDSQGKVELSSPLEAHSKHTLTLSVVALDTQFSNPVFAAIECDYSNYHSDGKVQFDADSSPLLLNYYELDQGLNHIVKKKSTNTIPSSATHLIPLPSHVGGVFVCCKNYIIYDNLHKNLERLYLPLPLRKDSEYTVVVSHVVHKLKKNNFFVLLQSSMGDLFKVTVEYNSDKELIEDIQIGYFDTIPVSSSLNILKSGFLFANVLNNDKLYYQFEKLGDDDENIQLKASPDISSIDEEDRSNRTFTVKALDNLALVEIFTSLSPITDAGIVESISSGTADSLQQMITASSHSHLKSLVHGIQTSTLVSSPLPIIPTGVLTTKLFADSRSDEYLVISSTVASRTLVLSIGEVVEEVENSQFVNDQPTLAVQQVGTSSVVQIYTNGIRHVKHTRTEDKEQSISRKITDWYPPAGITIVNASTHREQVIIALSNAEICYFEVDATDDQLIEYQDRVEMSNSITSIAICEETANKKNLFAVVGCSDETIQVLSLQPHNCLETLSLQALSANSTSLLMLQNDNTTMVHIGMDNGLYVRTSIEEISGNLSDTRIKYLGSKPVTLSVTKLPNGSKAILAISSRPWICYYNRSEFKVTPLLGVKILKGASFSSEDIGGEGIVALSDNNLIVFTIGKEDVEFDINQDVNIEKIRLRYTPRKLIIDDDGKSSKVNYIYALQSEYGTKSPFSPSNLNSEDDPESEIDQDYYDAFGYETEVDKWASCIQVVDFENLSIIQTVEFSSNESAISMAKLHFVSSGKGNMEHLIIGVTTDRKFLKNSVGKSYLFTFKIQKNTRKSNKKRLEYLHKTEIDCSPTVMIPFNGRLLVGMGKYLRLYDIGHRQLLRKSSTNIDYISSIVDLVHTGGERIAFGDSHSSIVFAKFDSAENRFVPFADDIMKRQITAVAALDYDTVIGGDKFGNVFVSRVPDSVSKKSDEDWSLLKVQESYLNASPSRTKNLCEFFLLDTPTSFTKGSMTIGGHDGIIYTGIQGTVGLLLPLSTKLEVQFINSLEQSLRQVFDYNFDDYDSKQMGFNLLGMDHLKFRSYYNPVKNVIDGDLIEKYYELSQSLKIKIARELNRTPKEVEKKISDLRNRSAF